MRLSSITFGTLVAVLIAVSLSGCLAASVAGATVGVAATAVGVTAKAASTTVHVGHVAVDAVTPDGKKDAGSEERQGEESPNAAAANTDGR